MSSRTVAGITGHQRVDGVVPGVRGQRAFPTRERDVIDPFVMLDHIGPEQLPDGFYVDGHIHPHRGFEALTMVFEGVMRHLDSTGFCETLPTGSTQNMVACRGIRHGGDMAADSDTHAFHEVQLWVNTPAANKRDRPTIRSAQPGAKPIFDRGNYQVEVVTGTLDGHTSPLATTEPTRVLRIRISGAGSIGIEDIDPEWNALVYVLTGSIRAGTETVDQFHTIAYRNDGDQIDLTATDAGVDLLVLTGKPIGEPIAMGGPWVMNTKAELRQAQADYEDGRIWATLIRATLI